MQMLNLLLSMPVGGNESDMFISTVNNHNFVHKIGTNTLKLYILFIFNRHEQIF